MPGTLRGVINQRLWGDPSTDCVQVAFTNLWRAFQLGIAAGQLELIASNYGAGGTGFDYFDGANPSGANAWFVVRFPPNAQRTSSMYVLVQWTPDLVAFGTAPGNPGLVQSNTTDTRVGIAVASARDAGGADVSPWGGSTNADGADTKSDPVWALPAGGELYLFPRSNATGGSDAVSAQNTQQVVLGSRELNGHVVYDDDNLVVFVEDAEGTIDSWLYAGRLVLEPDLDVDIDLWCGGNTSVILTGSTFGDLTGSGSDQSSIHLPINRVTALSLLGDFSFPTSDYTFQPNDAYARAEPDNDGTWWEERPITIFAAETLTGQVGHIDMDGVCFIFGMAPPAVLERPDGAQRRVIGTASNTLSQPKITVPWFSGSNPLNSYQREGIEVEQ